MVYMLTTRFRIGIFLSETKARSFAERTKAKLRSFDSWESAVNDLKTRERTWDYTMDWKNFIPNKLYKVMDDKIYSVISTKYRAGFVKTEDFLPFIEKHHFTFYYLKTCLTYEEAIKRLWNLGITTPPNTITSKSLPRCGWVYNRRL